MPVPDFCKLNKRIDARLNEILHHALARDPKDRYPSAHLLLYDLEHYIYHSGYGPTNETLGRFIRELFGQKEPKAVKDLAKTGTLVIERPAGAGAEKAA
jgi:serine/threonine-protein kinase